ncbi:MAG: CAP domain-containing protein [Acutalibacteraceae bacterium]
MKKAIISAVLAAMLATGLSSCKPNSDIDITQSTTASTTAAETTSTTVTAAATTTSAPLTTLVETTKAVATTVKKVTTTKKTVTTTKAQKTTAAPTTEKVTKKVTHQSETSSYNEELKYGVVRSRTVTTYYDELPDGTRKTVNEEYDDSYARVGYHADYEDLLPAAKQNRKTYADEIDEILDIINGYRAENGAPPLKLDEKLTEVACARAEEIAWSGKHSHYRPNGFFFSSILKDAGINSGKAGENIGWGYKTAADVCKAWKESQTHYENLMNPDFVIIGIGVAADPNPEANLCWVNFFLDKTL